MKWATLPRKKFFIETLSKSLENARFFYLRRYLF
jgi:hypothetical protein